MFRFDLRRIRILAGVPDGVARIVNHDGFTFDMPLDDTYAITRPDLIHTLEISPATALTLEEDDPSRRQRVQRGHTHADVARMSA